MEKPTSGWRRITDFLALNAATATLLFAVLCVGMGEELWSPFVPKYLRALGASLLLVGLYSAGRNLAEGFLYLSGGILSQSLGVRTSLVAVGLVPLIGYGLLGWAAGPALGIVGGILVTLWEPLSVPGIFAGVAQALGPQRRTMAFALQSIQKRVPKIIGPLIGGFVLTGFGVLHGVRALLLVSTVLALLALAAQLRFLPKGRPRAEQAASLTLLRQMPPMLRRLLAAEVFARWGDWLQRDFIVLYCLDGLKLSPSSYGGLVALQMTVALLTYLPVGWLVDRTRPRPFIGLTFIFFALFPLLLYRAEGRWGLILAFVVYGLREIGEPARKALITNLMPESHRAQAVGAYWAARSFFFFPAPLVGAWVWTSLGPRPLLLLSSAVCAVGAAMFLLGFGKRSSVS